ncbi:MAG: hypothetical protein SGJ13_16500 [Actinomycetota bacterium]|nr:hypothetical protein [Actinomycetota bacterium]
MRDSYGITLDDDTLAFIVDPVRAVKDSMHFYFQPVYRSKAKGVPVTYVKNLRDRAVPPALQDEMIARLREPPVAVVDLDTGHIPMVTEPEAFAQLLQSCH